MKAVKEIACFGSSEGVPGSPEYEAMVEVGSLLAKRGYIVLTGGYSGTGMEAPAKGATISGGRVIGFTILEKPGNNYLSQEVDCQSMYINPTAGPTDAIPPPEVQFGIRLGNLLSADGFIFAAGGGSGTMAELMAAINFGYKFWETPKKIAILKVAGNPAAGWDDAMLAQLEAWHMLAKHIRQAICIAKTAKEAVDWVYWV